MDNKEISPIASGIMQGLQEAIADASGTLIDGIKKSIVYRIQPQTIRRQLNMSQSQFSKAFGIPIRTLQCWEQGTRTRKIDATTASYLRTIAKFPNEVQAALTD